MADTRGFVFGATGDVFITMARRAARSLRQAMPTAQIDLFTDGDLTDPVFDQIHSLSVSHTRPKMEALTRSRFDRTIYLDADIMVLVDVSEVFDLLDRCDMALAQAVSRNKIMQLDTPGVPRSFGVMNGGVIAAKGSEQVRSFVADWGRTFVETKATRDQAILRQLLWASDLRVLTLPMEYNYLKPVWLKSTGPNMGAPRILHITAMDRMDPGDPETPFDLAELVGEDLAGRIRWLIRTDYTLGGDPSLPGP